jgi:hypothetical protein
MDPLEIVDSVSIRYCLQQRKYYILAAALVVFTGRLSEMAKMAKRRG